MHLIQQFGFNKSLDLTLQLIYTSNKLFSSFELDNGVGLIIVDEKNNFTNQEKKRILTHFLNLIEYFSCEKLYLIEDPIDLNRYNLIGMHRGV